MPNYGQEFQYVSDALKDVYAPVMKKQIPKISPLYNLFQKKPKQAFAGKQFIIPLQLTFSEAVGGKAGDVYTLPTPRRISYDQASITVKKIYGRVGIDGLALKSSQGKGGWVDLLTNEIEGNTAAFAIDLDRQLLCGGKGVLGLVHTTISSSQNFILVKDPGGITGDTPITKFYRKGMVVTVGTGSTEYTITGITPGAAGTAAISVSPNIAAATAGDAIYRSGVYSATADKLGEVMGIEGIVGTGNTPGSTFEGIDASAVSEWQAYVDSAAHVISTAGDIVFQDALDAIEQVSAGEPVDIAITGYKVRNELIKKMQALRQIDTLDLKAGWKAIKYIGGALELPFLVHPKCPEKYVYLLSTPHLKIYELLPLTWDNSGGGVIKPVAGSDAYEAWFKTYINFGTDCRNAHGKMTNVS